MKARDDAIDEHGRPTRLIPALDGGGFEVKPSPIHGNGTFATRAFTSGEPIGHAATTRSADQITPEDYVVIDRTVLGRYINHAREPNTRLAELKPGLLHMVAARDIPAGQELTCHYVDAMREQRRSYQKKNKEVAVNAKTALARWRKQAADYPEEKRLSSAVQRVDPEPTVAQREAGNHRMGHVRMHGLNITVEVANGQTRTGVGKDGKVWKKPMKCHYGYIKRTRGADGDHVDVYVGPHPQSEVVFVVDQVHSDGSFDEHKSLLGFTNQEEAKDMYLAHIPADRLGGITPMVMKDFKHWAFKGITRRPLKKASLLECEAPLGEDYVSTFPKLAMIEAIADTSASLTGAESLGQSSPQGITFDDEPAAGQVQPLLGAQPAEPLPTLPPQPAKGPGMPPIPPRLAPPPPQLQPQQPQQPQPGAQQPGVQQPPPPAMPMRRPPGQPALPTLRPPPALPGMPGMPGMPPKLANLLDLSGRLAARAGPRPVYLPEEGSLLASPQFLMPALGTTAGAALSGPDWEDRARGGLKGLSAGLGAVAGGTLGHRLGGTPGALAGGAGGGLLSLLLARKLLDRKKPEFNTVRFRKRPRRSEG